MTHSNVHTGPIPIIHQNANPLLYTLPQEHMIRQILQRLWNFYQYRLFYSTVEIALLR
ncbi:hypothetical protein I4U23_015659 [Adineta vaga]|nr:hypothetical protein I4U23_015659 [Adineta vaga]